jgi:hypothetical protein
MNTQVQAILHRNLVSRCSAADVFGLKRRSWLAGRDLNDGHAFDHPTSHMPGSVAIWRVDVVSGATRWSKEYEVLYGVKSAKFNANRRAFRGDHPPVNVSCATAR